MERQTRCSERRLEDWVSTVQRSRTACRFFVFVVGFFFRAAGCLAGGGGVASKAFMMSSTDAGIGGTTFLLFVRLLIRLPLPAPRSARRERRKAAMIVLGAEGKRLGV